MATRGTYIFDGYIKGRGMVRVFTDLDNKNFVFADSMKRDVSWYVHRNRVGPRKTSANSTKNSTTVQKKVNEEKNDQLTLF